MNHFNFRPMKNRREFIKSTAVLGVFGMLHQWASAIPAADTYGDILPMRRLIRNGEKVTAYSVGGWHLGNVKDASVAEKMVETSMDMGVRFFDTARGYQSGGSEERMGRLLVPKYRDQIFLMTKSHAKTETYHLYLWQIHTFTTPEDVDQRIDNGVLDVFLKAKEQGKTRYIGFSGHQSPLTHLYFLKWLEERGLELDTCQLPMNVLDPSFESFQKQVLPVLLDKEYGIIAMKTMSGGSMMGKRIDTTPEWIKTEMIPDMVRETGITPAELHQYVYTLPVSTLVSGCTTLAEMEHNIGVLQNFRNLSDSDMQRLEETVKPYAGLIVENYKRVLSI
jgi:aryl-alcohol dehydrogenase-like predicted oxidoreductase